MSAVRLMAYNTLEGGDDEIGGQRFGLLVDVVRSASPDVLVACEAPGTGGDTGAFESFAAAVEMEGQVTSRAPGGYDVAVLVRRPVRLESFEPVAGELNALAVAEIHSGAARLRLAAAHLDYRHAPARRREAELLVDRLGDAELRLVMGDLNGLSPEDAPDARTLERLPDHHVERHARTDGSVDTDGLSALLDSGLVDAWKRVGGPAGDGTTVPTDVAPGRFGPMRIDFILLSTELSERVHACRVERTPASRRASDHFPVIADVELP